MANPRLWLAYATTARATAALIVTFSYLAPFLTDTTGVPSGAVPVVLALYGLGAMVGITVGGRTADAHPFRTLYVGAGGLVAASAVLALLADQPLPAVVAITLLGAFGFAVNPGTQHAGVRRGRQRTHPRGGGQHLGLQHRHHGRPWLGGVALDAGAGYPSLAVLGTVLGIVAMGVITVSMRRRVAVTP